MTRGEARHVIPVSAQEGRDEHDRGPQQRQEWDAQYRQGRHEARGDRHYATFSDPDGNSWVFQEVTTRLPGRVDAAGTAYASTADLADAMRRASAAHGEHEKRIGAADPDWPDWYAAYMVAEQAGTELPQ
jgi:hypothetical protein